MHVYAGASNVMQVNAPECQKHRKDCLHMRVDASGWNLLCGDSDVSPRRCPFGLVPPPWGLCPPRHGIEVRHGEGCEVVATTAKVWKRRDVNGSECE